MTGRDFRNTLPNVKSREDFARWLALLAADYRKHPDEWTPQSVSDFLGALAVYLSQDFEAVYRNIHNSDPPAEPTWAMLATTFNAVRKWQ